MELEAGLKASNFSKGLLSSTKKLRDASSVRRAGLCLHLISLLAPVAPLPPSQSWSWPQRRRPTSRSLATRFPTQSFGIFLINSRKCRFDRVNQWQACHLTGLISLLPVSRLLMVCSNDFESIRSWYIPEEFETGSSARWWTSTLAGRQTILLKVNGPLNGLQRHALVNWSMVGLLRH